MVFLLIKHDFCSINIILFLEIFEKLKQKNEWKDDSSCKVCSKGFSITNLKKHWYFMILHNYLKNFSTKIIVNFVENQYVMSSITYFLKKLLIN